MPTPGIRTSAGRRASSDTNGCMKKYASTRSSRGRDAEEEREAAHRADREQVEHDRADQRHEVGGDDRAERARNPLSSDERTVLPGADLVLQSLEVHDVASRR